MNFGRCKECLEYKYLVGDMLCRSHYTGETVSVGVETRFGAYDPVFLTRLGELLVNEPRIESSADDYTARLVVADMELIVEDADGDPVETFAYSEYPDATAMYDAAVEAIEWIATYFGSASTQP